jgi:hypothetical protein
MHLDPALADVLDELADQPALAQPGVGGDPDHLAIAFLGTGQGVV